MNEQLKELEMHNNAIFDEIEKHNQQIRQLKSNLRPPCQHCIHDGFACDGCARNRFQNFEEAK